MLSSKNKISGWQQPQIINHKPKRFNIRFDFTKQMRRVKPAEILPKFDE
jgi:hypothetical protein